MQSINEENKAIWNTNADYWNARMGVAGNDWHRELIAPITAELLQLQAGDSLLDIGCGNGIFARRMQAQDIQVTAFDFAERNIQNAKQYPSEGIEYLVLDAADYDALLQLGTARFNAAVANMVLMDTPAIEPLFRALASLLKPKGRFVFSVSHPCFHSESVVNTGDSIQVTDYPKLHTSKGEAIRKQPKLQYFFDRSISALLQVGFQHGFVVDGFEEPVFTNKHKSLFTKIPPVLIVRMRR